MNAIQLHNTVRQMRLNVRRWGMQWRVMNKRRDRAGERFAIERALLWRNSINKLSQ